MKRIFLILSIFAGVFAAKAQDDRYSEAMRQAVSQMEQSVTTEQILTLRNRFEMIFNAYPDQWLAAYYVAMCDVDAVLRNPRSQDAPSRLEDAKKYIDLILRMDGADISEINTLYGCYYMALISTDPERNGPALYGKPTEYFDKAIKLDPSNPRPVLVRAFYTVFLPEFIRPDIDVLQEAAVAGELLRGESVNIEKPFWGRSYYHALTGGPLEEPEQ